MGARGNRRRGARRKTDRREAAAVRDRPAGEGAFVEGGEQVERAAGVGASGERARAGVEVGDELGESGGVGRAGVGRETLRGLREAVALLVGDGGEGEAPVVARGAGEMGALEGGDLRADFGPIAEEVEQMVHGVDAEARGGPAEFGGPLAAPRAGIKGSVAEPEGVTTATSGRPSRPSAARRRR